jgi:hypothetical protein
MQTSGAQELGYASRAILSALIDELIATRALSPDAASRVLDKAVTNIRNADNYVWVKGAVTVVTDIGRELHL